MRVSKKIVTLLVVIVMCFVYLIHKTYNNKNVLNNEQEEPKVREKMAIKIENDSGEYVYASSFPGAGYYINESMTECVDQAGNKATGVSFSVSGTSVTVKSKYTAYCTLYFSKCSTGKNTVLANKSGLSACPVGGMYRYQGTSVNNYICFGTNNKATCTGSPATYMYRIIGVTPDNHLKIMKETDLGVIYWLSPSSSINNDRYYSSYAYSQLNGAAFLNNDTYVPSGWSNKIFAYNYYNGYSNNFLGTITANEVYQIETGLQEAMGVVTGPMGGPTSGLIGSWKSNSFKIALPYVHDYLYSIANNTSNCSSSGSCPSWMVSSNSYKTMTTCGMGGNAQPCGVYYVANTANINTNGSTPEVYYTKDTLNVRPTFYLNSNTTLSSATGSSSDSFIITNLN